jgi:threonine dehydrogenase-like Zn-dependent dehydrogenase
MATGAMQAGVFLAPGRMGIQSRAVPEPAAGEALIRIRACGVCGSDLHLVHANPPIMPPGRILGHECSGTVERLGAGTTGLEVGQRVVVEPLRTCGTCVYCRSGQDSICRELQILGVHTDGAFAEYISVPARRVYPIPQELDFRTASLTEPIAVAVHGLRMGGFKPGQRILVLGAGAIGLAAVAVAKAWGAGEILLTARHPHQADMGRRLGADQVLSEKESTVEALVELGRQKPMELVVETVGGHANTLVLGGAAVAPAGTVLVLGLTFAPVPIDAFVLLHKEARLQWANCYHSRESGKADFLEAVQLLQQNRQLWSAMQTHCLPLKEIDRAIGLAGDKKSGSVKVTVMMEG